MATDQQHMIVGQLPPRQVEIERRMRAMLA